MNRIELLAPAGNFECLVAAVQSGADAVYLSGKSFGARSFADNFDRDELEKTVDYCHLRGVRVYVTVNTLTKDNEMAHMRDYLLFLNRAGVDAIIVQDIGVVNLSKRIVPKLPVHASTQMTVYNTEGVKFLEKMGINRVVLAREVSLENIKSISDETNAELEVFGHGALCMCYSGQCLMSSIIGGRSGNRGKCAQPCRLPYSVGESDKKAYYLSLKDLSSLHLLEKMQDAGVKSLKIEGRMKGPAYVAAVVGMYRKYLDNPAPVSKEDIELLDIIFNRGGLTDGYLTGKTGPDMFAIDKPDNPYRMGSDKLTKEILADIKSENRKLELKGECSIKCGEAPCFKVKCGEVAVEYIGEDIIEKAVKNSLTKEFVKTQLTKTGGTPFEFENIEISVDEGVFMTASALNNLRRNALAVFEEAYINSFKNRISKPDISEKTKVRNCSDCGFSCQVTNIDQFNVVKGYNFTHIYVPIHIIEENLDEISKVKDKVILSLPEIIHENEFNSMVERAKNLLEKGFLGVCVNNIGLIDAFKNYKIFGGFRLNIFNSEALEFYSNMQLVEVSPELNFAGISQMDKTVPIQVMAYGRLPLMICENCVIKNAKKCPCNGVQYIKDRMGMKFPVIKDGNACRSIILNCKKTFMGFDMDKLYKTGAEFFRLYFTDESVEECKKVCETFLNGGDYRPEDFTNGHFIKGVL